MAKFKIAARCKLCGRIWKKPSLKKYDICFNCRQKLKSKNKWNEENLNKNSISHTQKCKNKTFPSGF